LPDHRTIATRQAKCKSAIARYENVGSAILIEITERDGDGGATDFGDPAYLSVIQIKRDAPAVVCYHHHFSLTVALEIGNRKRATRILIGAERNASERMEMLNFKGDQSSGGADEQLRTTRSLNPND
jgi:hypothetical protein